MIFFKLITHHVICIELSSITILLLLLLFIIIVNIIPLRRSALHKNDNSMDIIFCVTELQNFITRMFTKYEVSDK